MTDESHNLRDPATRSDARKVPAVEDNAATIRTTPVQVDPNALPDQASHYVAPRPVARASEHKTIDMVPVRLAPHINPRHAPTQRVSVVPRRRGGSTLLLSGAAAALVLLLIALGGMRWKARAAVPASSARVLASSWAPEGPAPAVAAIRAPEPVVSAAPISRPEPKPRSGARPTKSEAPASAPAPSVKGREVWLE